MANINDILLGRGKLDLDNDAIIARCYDFVNKYKLEDLADDARYGKLNGRLSTVVMAIYLSENNLHHQMPHNWIELKPLVDIIKQQANTERIDLSWFNILPPGTYLGEHTHSLSRRTGSNYGVFVYYPKIIEGDSPLEIFVNEEWIKPSISTGDWLSFELELLHRVPQNTTGRHRISFSFNV